MTKISKIFMEILDELTGFERISEMMIKVPTDHIVRGFLLDRTSEKDCYLIYMFLLPLFSPIMDSITLNFTERVLVGDNNRYVLRSPKTGINDLDNIVAEMKKMIPRLESLSSPEQFIEYCERRNYERLNIKVELAIAHGLIGNVDTAASLLADVLDVSLPDHEFISFVQTQARRIISALEKDKDSFIALVSEWEKLNSESLFPGLTRVELNA